jgi:hypothetical protein
MRFMNLRVIKTHAMEVKIPVRAPLYRQVFTHALMTSPAADVDVAFLIVDGKYP